VVLACSVGFVTYVIEGICAEVPSPSSGFVGKLRMCSMMVPSLKRVERLFATQVLIPVGIYHRRVHCNNNPTSTMMDFLMGEKVAMMNENEVQWIVQAMKASLGLLVHGKIFTNQNACILASRGLIKFMGMVLHDINKEQAVVILLFGLVNQHSA
jgi:hypothetical protein